MAMANSTRLGTVTALLTMSLLIPAGWDSLGADGPEGNQEARPAIQTLQMDDARVEIRVDRPVVDAGQRVRVALAAYSDSRDKVDVMIALQSQDSMQMSRMPSPPVTIESERMTLAANGTSREISFVLAGNDQMMEGMDPMQLAGGIRQYSVLVTKATKANKKANKKNQQLAVWDGMGVDGAAMVQVAARQKPAYQVAMSFDSVAADGTVQGTVTIRNLTKKTLKEINANLTPYPTYQLNNTDFEPTAWEIKWTGDSEGQIAELGPRATKSIRFEGKLAEGANHGTLYANVWAGYGGMGSASQTLDLGAVAANQAPQMDEASAPVAMQFAEPPPAL